MKTLRIDIGPDYKEQIQHGSLDYPLAIYTEHIQENILGFINWHWHDELQFCIVTQDSVQFDINQNHLLLHKGDILWINSGQLHRATNPIDSDGTYICIDLHPQFLKSFVGSRINHRYIDSYILDSSLEYCVFYQSHPLHEKIASLLNEACMLYETNGSELLIWIHFLEIWSLLVENVFPQQSRRPPILKNRVVKTILAYSNAHYTQKITLEELAETCGYSQSTCCRIFKNTMGCTIFEYILSLRLQHASKLLTQTDLNVTEIAYQCGFGSASYFIRKFQKKTGQSPLFYRKQTALAKSIKNK